MYVASSPVMIRTTFNWIDVRRIFVINFLWQKNSLDSNSYLLAEATVTQKSWFFVFIFSNFIVWLAMFAIQHFHIYCCRKSDDFSTIGKANAVILCRVVFMCAAFFFSSSFSFFFFFFWFFFFTSFYASCTSPSLRFFSLSWVKSFSQTNKGDFRSFRGKWFWFTQNDISARSTRCPNKWIQWILVFL